MFAGRSNTAIRFASILAISPFCAGYAPQGKTITVTEATNVQVTVSPDHTRLLADIQGLIYSIPLGGGAARQLTQPEQEASHPDWSRNDVVALQCYAGGTFHIWTMRPDGTGLKQITSGHGDDREPRISLTEPRSPSPQTGRLRAPTTYGRCPSPAENQHASHRPPPMSLVRHGRQTEVV